MIHDIKHTSFNRLFRSHGPQFLTTACIEVNALQPVSRSPRSESPIDVPPLSHPGHTSLQKSVRALWHDPVAGCLCSYPWSQHLMEHERERTRERKLVTVLRLSHSVKKRSEVPCRSLRVTLSPVGSVLRSSDSGRVKAWLSVMNFSSFSAFLFGPKISRRKGTRRPL
jgi:hypothetical protein